MVVGGVAPGRLVSLHVGEREQVERWFLRQGLPHLIHDYRASTDVFTRALPFLLVVFLFNVIGAFGDRFTGWAQAGIAVLSSVLILGGAIVVNVVRGRRPLQLPNEVGRPELAMFVILPALPTLLFGTDRVQAAVGVVALNIVILGVVYVIVGFGLVPTTIWALGQTFRHLSQLLTLMGRALPFVLVFSAFLFLNAELWQVAHDFTPLAFWVTVGLLSLVAGAFIALRIPREIAQIAQFRSWDQVVQLAADGGSPLPDYPLDQLHGRCDPPLSRADRLNVSLVVLFNMGLQIVLVSAAIGLFYVVFGVFAVREDTIVVWTTLQEIPENDVLWSGSFFGTGLVLTVQLIRVVGFLVAFSALQFAVAAVTDTTYREEFFEEVTGEVRQALAVRSVYLDRLVDV